MNILIIEDEQAAARRLQKLVNDIDPSHQVLDVLSSIEASVAWLNNHTSPDVILMDIHLADGSSFEIFEKVKITAPVIFVTAFDDYALQAFKVNAIDYLLKPFNQERFDKAINRWREKRTDTNTAITQPLLETASRQPNQNQRIVVKTGSKIKIIPVDDILYLEAADDYVKIHTKEGVFLKNKTMSHFEGSLDPQIFVRTHRSYIVHIQRITRIEPHEKESYLALLTTGAQVPVSKSGYAKLKTILGI